MVGARTYTLLRPIEPHAGSFVTIPDAFLLSVPCTISAAGPTGQFVRCALRNWWKMPGFAAIKIIGLIDDPYLSSYATYVTPPWLRVLLHLLALPVLAGLLAAVWLAFDRRTGPTAWKLMLLFYGAYLLLLTPLTIEYRYGLPLIPVCLFTLAHWIETRRSERSRALFLPGIMMLCSCVFLSVVIQWDRHDPIPYIPAATAAARDILQERVRSLPGLVTQ